MPRAKITSKGQITIPASVRKAMGLETGSTLLFSQDEKGQFRIQRALAASELAGCIAGLISPMKAPMTVEEMDEEIGRYVVEMDEATKSSPEQISDSEAA